MNQDFYLNRECVAEFLGNSGLLIFLRRVGCVAACGSSGASFGQWESSVLFWGIGVAMAIYLTAGVSGAHLNPAVTHCHCGCSPVLNAARCLPFIVAQTAGAFCAAALVYGLYRQLFLRS